MEKSVIIVGAGMAGLSAGCYARMNGYKAQIYEMHTIPGGLCTAWKKRGYTFDISMHMLTGSVSGPFHQMWKELGVINNFKFHFHDQISQIEGMNQKLNISVNRQKFEQDLLAISPGDRKLIRQFIRIIFGPDLMKASTLKPAPLVNLFDKLRMLPAMLPLIPLFMKYGKITLQQFAAKFQDPFLRKAIRYIVDSPGWPMPDFPMLALIGFIKGGVKEAGVPLGGSQQVALYMADLFKKSARPTRACLLS
jgi:phytoene dehydrogenase-like protein